MIKKLIAALLAGALIASPAYAHDRNQRHHNKVDAGAIIAGVVVGVLIATSDRRESNEDQYYERREDTRRYYDDRDSRRREVRTVCWTEPARDYYGNYYRRTVCNR